MCMNVCKATASYLQRPEEGTRCPEIRIANSCKWPRGLLLEQPVLLTTKPSLEALLWTLNPPVSASWTLGLQECIIILALCGAGIDLCTPYILGKHSTKITATLALCLIFKNVQPG